MNKVIRAFVLAVGLAICGHASAAVLPGAAFQMVDADGRVLGRAFAYSDDYYPFAIIVNGIPAFLQVRGDALDTLPRAMWTVDFEGANCVGQPYIEPKQGGGLSLRTDKISAGLIALTGTSPDHRIWLANRTADPQRYSTSSRLSPVYENGRWISKCENYSPPADPALIPLKFPAQDAGSFIARPPFRLQVEPPQTVVSSSPVDAVHPVGLAVLFLALSGIAALIGRRRL